MNHNHYSGAASLARNMLLTFLAGILLLGTGCATAKDFVFKDMQGKEQRLSDYRGKWVLVNFWATWCPPCLAEMPDLIAMHNAHKDKDLVVIGVALDSTRESVTEFVSKIGVTYPIVLGNYKMAAQIGNIEAMPTTYLFDPNGKSAAVQEGAITRNSLEEFLRTKKK